MRITSLLFVSALIQTQRSQGCFVTVLRKGSPDAGAVFIIHLGRDGKADFYGPVPQVFLSELDASERYFELLYEKIDQADIDLNVEKQQRFDPDCWIVEIESDREIKGINIITPE